MMRILLIIAAIVSIRSVLAGDIAIGMNYSFILALLVSVFAVWDMNNYISTHKQEIRNKFLEIKNRLFNGQGKK